ncbi:MAG: helix-turn-helix transcriptional regulator [Coriobacteriia bacterium]|nr:helix-turn-helix transcriptional regulator [Coriobacteriia bacterium]MBS5479107.1 helix-turn-helix transcriptional regulator [Coriobacteriia bacterium]
MAEASLAVRCVIAGYLAQAALYLGMSFLGGWAAFVACILALALSCALMGDALRRGVFSAAPVDGGSGRTAAYRQRRRSLRSALIPLVSSFTCVFILTIVVSLMHTSVIGNELEPVLGAVPMAEAHALATAIFVPVMALRRRVPDTTLVYRVLFPVMLVALSLLPFVSEALGTLSGLAMVVCYDIVGIAFVLLLVEVSQARRDVPPAALIGVYQVGTEASVAVGLVLGLGINRLGAHASEASYVTILMLACIYLLSTVLMVLLRRRGSVLDAAGPDDDAALAPREGNRFSQRTRGGDDAGAPPVGGAAAGEPAARDDAARAAWPDGEAGASGPDGTADGARVSAHPTPGEHAEQQSVREQVSARVELFAREKGLTPREAQVLVQLARGRSAPALAADLGITENTAWAHIKRIYMKLDVHGRQELIDLVEREVISPAGDEG